MRSFQRRRDDTCTPAALTAAYYTYDDGLGPLSAQEASSPVLRLDVHSLAVPIHFPSDQALQRPVRAARSISGRPSTCGAARTRPRRGAISSHPPQTRTARRDSPTACPPASQQHYLDACRSQDWGEIQGPRDPQGRQQRRYVHYEERTWIWRVPQEGCHGILAAWVRVFCISDGMDTR